MSKEKILAMQKQVTGKLMAATSMLLVSAILMCLTSYAWFILSTAPEVSNLKTTAGANGALEIALAGTTVADGIARPSEPNKMGVGTSGSLINQPISVANTFWGNLVDIGSIYGLENLTLYPSRLNLSAGLQNTVLTDSPLVVPKFGEDGRILSLDNIQKASYNYQTETYSLDTNYGVHLLGYFNNGESAEEDTETRINRQDIVDTMSSYVESSRDTLREQVIAVMEDHSRDFFRLLIEMKFAMDPNLQFFGVTKSSQETSDAITDIVNRLDTVSKSALDSLRYAVMARCSADTVHYPNTEEGNRALGAIYIGFSEMTTDTMAKLAQENGYTEITNAVTSINEVRNRLERAKNQINSDSPGGAAMELFSALTTSIGGKTGGDMLSGVEELSDSANHTSTMYTWLTQGDIRVFPGMADIVGDYEAILQAYVDYSEVKDPEKYADTSTKYPTAYGELTYAQLFDGSVATKAGDYTLNMRNTLGSSSVQYDPDKNIGCLESVYNTASAATVDGDIVIVNQISINKIAYGYSIDLAFKSSAAGSLMLQQEAVDRVSGLTQGEIDAGNGNGGAMGLGSKMVFAPSADIEDPAILMEGLYIVFMDTREGTLYSIATIDASTATKNSDGTIEAPLRLYTPNINNGVVTKGTATTSILNMEADTTYYVTAVVFLNGDIVTADMLSATESISLKGSLNLQFGSSAELVPMNYDSYVPYKKKD